MELKKSFGGGKQIFVIRHVRSVLVVKLNRQNEREKKDLM
jgi:hypothetical protein